MSEPDIDQLRAEVEDAREQLVDTTQLLVQNLNVRARARSRLAELQAFARTHPQQVGTGGGALLVLLIVRRRRARKRRRVA